MTLLFPGGSISSFTAVSSTVYTATFTPSGAGATTIDVNAGANLQTRLVTTIAATQFTWTYDNGLTMVITLPRRCNQWFNNQ